MSIKRWFDEKWKDEDGNPCGSDKKKVKKCRPTKRVSSKTPKTWGELSSSERKKVIAEKKRVGMGKRTSSLRRKK